MSDIKSQVEECLKQAEEIERAIQTHPYTNSSSF